MAEEQLIGVEMVPDGIDPKGVGPIDLRKLWLDDFAGHGGKRLVRKKEDGTEEVVADTTVSARGGEAVVKNRNAADYLDKTLPRAVEAGTIGDAFAAFGPSWRVTLESPDRPGEKEVYEVPFESMGDFDPESLVRRIPTLRKMDDEEKGLLRLAEYAQTEEGARALLEVMGDGDLADAFAHFAGKFAEYLQRTQRVIPAGPAADPPGA
jgi:predicted component of type VI protein secretion system